MGLPCGWASEGRIRIGLNQLMSLVTTSRDNEDAVVWQHGRNIGRRRHQHQTVDRHHSAGWVSTPARES